VFHSGYVEIEVEKKGGRRKPKPTDKLKKSETENTEWTLFGVLFGKAQHG